MRTKNRRKCLECGRSFTVERYNKHHQKYCTYPDCVLKRSRERKRKWYSERCRNDPDFCEKERIRCKESMTRTREQKKQTKILPIESSQAIAAESSQAIAAESSQAIAAESSQETTQHILTGIIARLNNCYDPQLLNKEFQRYADHGRRLSVSL